MSRFRSQLPAIGVALAAIGIAIAYASVTARLGGRIALPADDAYRHLACAAQRGEICAGSPSLTWPALLALPAAVLREHALVVAAFAIAAALYAATVVGCQRVARRIAGELGGVLAAVAMLAIAPLAWASLAGLEVAITTTTWIGALELFARRGDRDTPGWALAIVLVALGLARHETLVVVALVVLAGVMHTTSWRGVATWLVVLAPPIAWAMLSEPRHEAAIDLEALRGDGAPLAYVFAALWLAGVVRMRSWLGALVVLTPIAYLLAGGTTAAFPACAIAVGCAVAPVARAPRARIATAIVCMLVIAALAVMPLRASLVQFAQDAADLDRRVARLAPRLHGVAAIGAHDPGAVALYSGARVVALDGTDPNEGPGARFERLERLAVDTRPTHFISSPGALGFDALFGDVLAIAPVGPKLAPRRGWTRGEVQLVEARWDHVATAERPLAVPAGWRVVDRIDVADLEDEAAHHWQARTSGKQATLFHREVTTTLLLDGGRTVVGGERFAITVDPAKPFRLVLRTGGNGQYPDHERTAGATLQVAGKALTVPAPRGPLIEVALELPPGDRERVLTVDADRPYRVFHWFVLQPH